MICSNCGTQNAEESKFCIKCGNQLQMNYSQTEQNMNMINNEQPVIVQTQNYQQQNISVNNLNNSKKIKLSIGEYFHIIFSTILKPSTTFKEKLNEFENIKNSIVIALIISCIATLVTLVKTMISAVRVTSYWSNEVKWVWENLKEIKYIQVIGQTFLIYLGIIFVVACVYYIAGLVVKKQPNFSRLLGVTAISVVPMLLCALLLSPLLTMIYAPLGVGVTIFGAVYTLIIIYETINNEILLEGNAKYYFNLICLSILIVAGYYIYMKFFMASTGDLSDIFNMFG
ncbi:MAG: zinc-ribbon domain-containing protein [Bacilli bacterium]|nr:zinc-ribbon domain-containing protein [Bacilli bacterium]